MIISPSIASADVMNIAEETRFIDEFFPEIHIDIEDGVAVMGISFGMKVARGIRKLTKKPVSIHLEVLNPLNYLSDLEIINPEHIFIQCDILENPLEIIREFQKHNLNVGLAIGNRDIGKDYSDIYKITNSVLVSTAFHEDYNQNYQNSMENIALDLAEKGLKVWIDGGVDYQKYCELKESKIYAAVMGRGVFGNKQEAIENYC